MKRLTGTATNITQGSISAGLFQLALPAMISMLAIMLYEFIDLFWIGKLGAEAVAALGAAAFVLWTIKALANCVAAGLNALIARNAGAENFQRAQMWASQGLMLTVAFAMFIAAITYLANLFLFDLLGLAPAVARNAQRYTMITTLSLVFIYGSVSLDTIFRAMGNTFIPMVIMVTGLALNAILDPVFIFGWLGAPKMGMPGAALASALAHFASMLMLLFALPLIKIRLKVQFHHFLIHARQVLEIGMPIGLLGAIFSIIYIALSKNIAYFGTVPLAAISIAHRIEGIPFFIAFGFSTAVATVVGQNLGAGKPDRAARGAHLSLAYAVAFLSIISISFIIYGKDMMRVFIDEPAVIDEGYRYLFAVAVFEIFLAAEVILEGAFTGAGDTRPPFMISIPLTALRIPMAYLFSIVLGYGVVAIWWTISFTTVLKGITFFLWFQRGHWKHRQIG
ncbi:MAG: MATE family efflux transporter [candidate division KSB1 bacterium]|nr:MATE family efflux transporter [candidate division KSB1 bacterium]MDZ7334502.1 MATE family efflux transporter [candidate division KSB1 bacterium]MDZ7377567.1 MATE family efflux transporter [candidate division KSB1 bacterium]MDZ7400989.1 MATE family efflux transporter [candidate division KSB1 bacterium]